MLKTFYLQIVLICLEKVMISVWKFLKHYYKKILRTSCIYNLFKKTMNYNVRHNLKIVCLFLIQRNRFSFIRRPMNFLFLMLSKVYCASNSHIFTAIFQSLRLLLNTKIGSYLLQ